MKKHILLKIVLLVVLGYIVFSCASPQRASKYKPEHYVTYEDFK